MLIPAVSFIEVFLMCVAAFPFFRMNGNTLSEAASYAVISVFMLLSFIRQITFISGISILSAGMEAILFIASIILIVKHRSHMSSIFNRLKKFESADPVVAVFLGICLLYMMGLVCFGFSQQGENELANIILSMKDGLFLCGSTSDASPVPAVNHLILFVSFFEFNTYSSAGVFSFLAYLSIGFSTYALSRRYAWAPTAFTTAILVMSMPRLIVQAISPGTEIISIAVVLFCVLALYRCVELPNSTDFVLLILGIFFSLSEHISSMIFAPILFVLSWIVLSRRHGFLLLKSILRKKRYAAFVVIPGVVFSQCWLFGYYHFYKISGSVIGSTSFNTDGIQGAAANFIRYLFESFYGAVRMDIFFDPVSKWDMAQLLEPMYDGLIRPLLGDSGSAGVFALSGMSNDLFSFGPAGFFLVFPAMLYAVLKGARRLKAVAISLFVYFYLIALIIAWAPDNIKFLGNFYVCSGFSIAFFLPPWRLTKRIKTVFQAGCCFLLFLTLIAAR